MAHDNRSRITIEQPGKPRLYQSADLPGWEIVGTVTRGESDTGALVRNLSTGVYAQATAGAIRTLDQRKVLAALGQFVNAKKMEAGRRRNIYVDDASWEIAQRLGGGNASEGIRKALELANASA